MGFLWALVAILAVLFAKLLLAAFVFVAAVAIPVILLHRHVTARHRAGV